MSAGAKIRESTQLELLGARGYAGERRLVHRRNGIVIRHEKTRVYNEHEHYQGTILDIGRTTMYLGQWYGDEAKWWTVVAARN